MSTISVSVPELKRKMSMEEIEKHIGSIPDTGDSVKEIRALRKQLSALDPHFKTLKTV